MATKDTMKKILDLASSFVKKQQGDWDHLAWEGFLADVEKEGVAINDEVKRNLGNILEGAKYFYSPASAASPAKKKAPAKAKAAAKAKPAAKPKAKAKAKPK